MFDEKTDRTSWKKATEQILSNRWAGAESAGDTALKKIEAVVTLSKAGEETELLTAETPVSVDATESLSMAETQKELMSLAQKIVDDLKPETSDSFDVSVRFTETRQTPNSPASQVSYDGSAFNGGVEMSPRVYAWHKYQNPNDAQPVNVGDIVVLFEEKEAALTVKEVLVVQGELAELELELECVNELQAIIGLDEKYRIIKAYMLVASGLVILSWKDEPRNPSKSATSRLVWSKRFFFKVI